MDKPIISNPIVASAQFDVKIFDLDGNVATMMQLAREAVDTHGADIVVFPEAALTGYCFATKEECLQAAVSPDDPAILRLANLCSDLNVSIAFGVVEKDANNVVRNAAYFLEPDGTRYVYYKCHLPYLGLDKHTEAGNSFPVFDTRFGKIGLIICYDLRFPEAARVLALQGARLIIQPTNLPYGGESHMDFFGRSRSCENRVHLVSCNRCGEERGFRFFGRSQVVDYTGKVLVEAGDAPGIVAAQLDLSLCDQKDIIVIPNDYETRIFKDRIPQSYGAITSKVNSEGYVL